MMQSFTNMFEKYFIDYFKFIDFESVNPWIIMNFRQFLFDNITEEEVRKCGMAKQFIVGKIVHEIAFPHFSHVLVNLNDEQAVYNRLCQECCTLGERGVSSVFDTPLIKYFCKQCGDYLAVEDPYEIYDYDTAEDYIHELFERNYA